MNTSQSRTISLLASLVLFGACSPAVEESPGEAAAQPLISDHESAAAMAYQNAVNTPPADWTGPVFQLSHDYPEILPAPPAGGYPWELIDFRTQPSEYMYAVLNYARQDLEAVDWDPTALPQPKWFHAPWMALGGDDSHAREFIHGMTVERFSRAGDLGLDQTTDYIANVAVGLYNDVGGWTFGRVWQDPGNPHFTDGAPLFNNGAMAIKLLFTRADPNIPADGVPFLQGSKEWQANMFDSTQQKRTVQTVRLLQVDIAIRDQRNDDLTGWVFGTFTYNADAPGAGPLDRLVPVGLMWGDSPGIAPPQEPSDLSPPQQWLNEDVQSHQHYGWAKRLNGPVDAPASSCMSCHGGNAQYPYVPPMMPTDSMTTAEKLAFFTNIPAGSSKDPGSISLDYSMQMQSALRNWSRWVQSSNKSLEASLPGDQQVIR